MSDSNSAKMFKSMLVAGAAATTAFAGFAAAPAIFSATAEAQRIDPPRVAPPGGAPGSFADLIQKVSPAVVSIQVRQRPNSQRDTPFDFENLPPGFEEFLRRFPQQGPQRAPQALGSGFIIDQAGLVVTNHHVVENAEEIDITTSDGKQLKADLIGTDESTDLAVLRIRGDSRYPYVQLDRSPTVRVGDWVVAVGNPFGLDGTATAGIVSATGRRDFSQTGSSYVDFLQIDAPINRGNSGGPTFDLRGNVIGVNSAIFSPTGGNVGIGFAIPSDTAARVVDQLIKSGKVSRGWLGVQIQAIDPEIAKSLGLQDDKGAIVASVTPGSPAAAAGFQQGDVVLRFNGEQVEDSRDLTRKVGATDVGRSTRVEVLRNGRRENLNVTLGERPSEQQLASLEPSTPSAGAGQETSGLGLSVRPASDEDRRRYDLSAVEGGLVVTNVADNSELAERGVLPGDVIVGAGPDRRPLRTIDDLNAAVEEARRDDRPVLLTVQGRAGPPRYVAVEVKKG
jgi:serine protease Do